MKKLLKYILEYLILFVIGGCTYYIIELLWQQHSHWSSFLMGGIALIFVGLLNEKLFQWDDCLILQMTVSSIFITCMEYIVGKLVNYDYSVWCYLDKPFNVEGQVCLGASLCWFVLSLLAIVLDDFIREKLFNEKRHKYKWI